MNLYLIQQNQNNSYDTYDSAVVAAPNEQTARVMHPANGKEIRDWDDIFSTWCNSADKVTVTYLGQAVKGTVQGVICASFNAG